MSRGPGSEFDRRWGLPPRPAGGAPVYLLAASWRSGSTLLQRLVASSGEILVWGEPYGRADLVPALARTAAVPGASWPTPGHFPGDEVFADLGGHWIANLFPPPEALREAYAAFLERLLAAPARERGCARFGLKEVRLTADDARFLEWIHPDARFVFLVRDPWRAWASMRGARWWARWPDDPVDGLEAFARHWRRRVEGFLDWPRENARLVRYEDLVQPEFDLPALAAHCRLSGIDGSVRERVLRGVRRAPEAVPDAEAERLAALLGEAPGLLGYGPAPAPPGPAGLADPRAVG